MTKITLIILLFCILVSSAPSAEVISAVDIYDTKQHEWTIIRAHWPVIVQRQISGLCFIQWSWKDGKHAGVIHCSNLRFY